MSARTMHGVPGLRGPHRLRRLLAIACVAIAGGLVGAYVRRSSEPSQAREAARFAEAVAHALAKGGPDELWALLSPRTKERFGRSHAGLVRGAAWYRDEIAKPSTSELVREAARRLESEHGRSLDGLVASTPQALWWGALVRAVGGDRLRGVFAEPTVREIRSDGTRALVELRLADGRAQGLPLERGPEGELGLVDLIPFAPCAAYRTESDEAAAAAPTSTAGAPSAASTGR